MPGGWVRSARPRRAQALRDLTDVKEKARTMVHYVPLEILKSFPFTQLPLELQLHIGRFTVERKDEICYVWNGIGFREPGSGLTVPHGIFSFAHVRRAFHKPVMRHFFRFNRFEFNDWDIRIVRKLVGIEYMAEMQSLIVHIIQHRDLIVTFEKNMQCFRRLRFLLVRVCRDRDTNEDVEETKLYCLGLFANFPKLEKVRFKGCEYERDGPQEIVRELTLRAEARGRGIDDVEVKHDKLEEDELEPESDYTFGYID